MNIFNKHIIPVAIDTPESPIINLKRSQILTIALKTHTKSQKFFEGYSEVKNIKNGDNYTYLGNRNNVFIFLPI